MYEIKENNPQTEKQNKNKWSESQQVILSSSETIQYKKNKGNEIADINLKNEGWIVMWPLHSFFFFFFFCHFSSFFFLLNFVFHFTLLMSESFHATFFFVAFFFYSVYYFHPLYLFSLLPFFLFFFVRIFWFNLHFFLVFLSLVSDVVLPSGYVPFQYIYILFSPSTISFFMNLFISPYIFFLFTAFYAFLYILAYYFLFSYKSN